MKRRTFRHFKGNEYELICEAKDSETSQDVVVYAALYGNGQVWVRPKEMFFGMIEKDGKMIPRFEEIKGANAVRVRASHLLLNHSKSDIYALI